MPSRWSSRPPKMASFGVALSPHERGKLLEFAGHSRLFPVDFSYHTSQWRDALLPIFTYTKNSTDWSGAWPIHTRKVFRFLWSKPLFPSCFSYFFILFSCFWPKIGDEIRHHLGQKSIDSGHTISFYGEGLVGQEQAGCSCRLDLQVWCLRQACHRGSCLY